VSYPLQLDGSGSVDKNVKSFHSSDISYEWVCVIIAAGNRYLNPCGIYNSTAGSKVMLYIEPNQMDSVFVYQITLYVTASDGRYSSASVIVYPSGNSIEVHKMSGPPSSQVNFDQKLSVFGEITAAVAVNATWSVSWGSVGFPISVGTNALTAPNHEFSLADVSGGVQFSLGIAANSFVSGRTYTFTLTGCEVDNNDACTFSQLDIRINGPPNSGSVAVSPSSGVSLQTSFSFSAINWLDVSTDYPLQYSFLFQLASTLPTMSIQGYSGNSFVTSILPAGLSTNQYGISVIALIADVFSCATSSTVSVAVSSSQVNNSAIAALLANTIDNFASTGDIDALFQVLNAASTTINAVNCTLARNCSGLFRENCVNTANTCGSCLSGYVGVVGDSNLRCFNLNNTDSGEIGSACEGDDDCVYGVCKNEVCAAPALECASNCSGTGRCEYIDTGNNVLSSCSILDVDCSAVCLCDSGFHGQDCSLTEDELTSLDTSRGSMCTSLTTAAKLQDNSSALLDTMVSSLQQAYSPYEVVSSDSIDRCTALLSYLSAVGRQGYIAGALSSTVQFLTNAMSSFVTGTQVQSQRRRRRLSSANSTGSAVGDAVSDMITGLTTGILGGETPTSITSANLRVSVLSPLSSSLGNSSLSPPATAAQKQYGSLLPIVSLASSGLSGCGYSSGYSPMSVMSWGSNPYSSDVSLQSSILRFGTGGTISSRRNLLDTVDVALSFTPVYYISLQFASKLELNFTAQRLGLQNNITLPECRYYDGSEFVDCHGCNISSYTDYNVTYGCYDVGVLCSGSSTARYLSRKLQAGESAASYAALAEAIAGEIVSVLSQNPFAINLEKAKAILAFVGSMLFVFIVGIFLTIPWDKFEHNRIVYVHEAESLEEKKKEEAKKHKKGAVTNIVDLVDNAFKVPFGFGAALAKSLHDSTGTTTNSGLRADKELAVIGSLDDEVGSVDDWDQENFLSDHALKENTIEFLGIVLPTESLLSNESLLTRGLKLMIAKHEWVDFFTEFNPQLSRTVRWIGLWKGLLINLFIDTLFFGIYFADDGTCELFTTEDECLIITSQLSSTGTKCAWNGTGCSLSPPPSDVTFTVVLALICVLICVPIDFGMSFVLEEMASKWPDLDSIGLSTAYWYGTFKLPEFSKPQFVSGLALFDKVKTGMHNYERDALSGLFYDDLRTPEEEVYGILATIHRVFCADMGSASGQETSLEAQNADKVTRGNAITENLGVYPNGELAPLSVFRRIRYGTSSNFLLSKIRRVREAARSCAEGLHAYEPYDQHFRDYFMIQTFILEHFTSFKKFALTKQLFFYKRMAPEIIPLYEYLAAWIFTCGAMLFFFYWVFAWGVKNGGVTLEAWGINFAIGAAQDIFCQNPIKIFVLYVAAAEVMRPQLKSIHRTLFNIAMRTARSSPQDFGFRVCQYTSSTCRAARTLDAFDLPASKLLRLVNDNDVLACRQNRITHEMLIITILIAIPAFLAVMGDPVADQVLDVLLSTMLSGITMFFSLLETGFGIVIMCIPIIIIVGYLLYRYGIFDRAVAFMSVKGEARKAQLKTFQASRKFRSSTPPLRRHLQRAYLNCIEWVIYLSKPQDMFEETINKRSLKAKQAGMWQRMNSPKTIIPEGDVDEINGVISNASERRGTVHITQLLPEEIRQLVPNALQDGNIQGRSRGPRDLAIHTRFVKSKRRSQSNKSPIAATEGILDAENARDGVKDVTIFAENALRALLLKIIFDTDFVSELLEEIMDEDYWHALRGTHTNGSNGREFVSAAQLSTLFQQVWETFYPGGLALTDEEVDRVTEYFSTWIVSVQEQATQLVGLIPIRIFVGWFRKLNRHIVQSRTRDNTPRHSGPVGGIDYATAIMSSVDEFFLRMEESDSSRSESSGSESGSTAPSHDTAESDFFNLFAVSLRSPSSPRLQDDVERTNSTAFQSFYSVAPLEDFYQESANAKSTIQFDELNDDWRSKVNATSVPKNRMVRFGAVGNSNKSSPSHPYRDSSMSEDHLDANTAIHAAKIDDDLDALLRMEDDDDISDSSSTGLGGHVSANSSNADFYKLFMGQGSEDGDNKERGGAFESYYSLEPLETYFHRDEDAEVEDKMVFAGVNDNRLRMPGAVKPSNATAFGSNYGAAEAFEGVNASLDQFDIDALPDLYTSFGNDNITAAQVSNPARSGAYVNPSHHRLPDPSASFADNNNALVPVNNPTRYGSAGALNTSFADHNKSFVAYNNPLNANNSARSGAYLSTSVQQRVDTQTINVRGRGAGGDPSMQMIYENAVEERAVGIVEGTSTIGVRYETVTRTTRTFVQPKSDSGQVRRLLQGGDPR
jgi:hypothetical protein